MVRPDQRPDRCEISFVGGDQTYDFKLDWRDNGTAESTWDIPKDAKLGEYSISLISPSRTPAPDPGRR